MSSLFFFQSSSSYLLISKMRRLIIVLRLSLKVEAAEIRKVVTLSRFSSWLAARRSA